MQKVEFPLTLDPVRTAQKCLDYEGVYASDQVERIAESVVSVDTDVECSIRCALDNQRLAVLTGDARVTVNARVPALRETVCAPCSHNVLFQSGPL